MPILNPLANEVFVVRSYKAFQSETWANTYELRVTTGGVTTAGLQQAALNIVNAEREFHFNTIVFWKHVISTYAPDSEPYNPLSFVTVNTALFGERSAAGADVLPLTTCAFVRFTSNTGRPGKRYYRGCLVEANVTFSAKGHLIDASTRTLIQTSLAPLLPEVAPGIDLVLASGSPNPTTVRPVLGFAVAELTTSRQLTSAYFDRV